MVAMKIELLVGAPNANYGGLGLARPGRVEPLPARSSNGRRGLHQTVIAPEQLLAHRQRRHADHPALMGFLGGRAQRLLDLRILRRRARRVWIETGPLGALQHLLGDGEVAAQLEGIAETPAA